MDDNELEEAQAYITLKDSVGGRLLEKHMRDSVAYHLARLRDCKTWEEVLAHRAAAEAQESVLVHIDVAIRKGVEEDAEV